MRSPRSFSGSSMCRTTSTWRGTRARRLRTSSARRNTRRYFRARTTIKMRTSDELWSIDWDFAEVDIRGEDAFTVACAGLKGTITSKRSSLIVVVMTRSRAHASIANPDIRREMETNWTNVIVPTMFQGARAIALGTRFHFDDLFATIFTEKKGGSASPNRLCTTTTTASPPATGPLCGVPSTC